MSYWILPDSDIPTDKKSRMVAFEAKRKRKLNTPTIVPMKDTHTFNPYHILNIDEEDPKFVVQYKRIISDNSITHANTYTLDSYDLYLHMEISLPCG